MIRSTTSSRTMCTLPNLNDLLPRSAQGIKHIAKFEGPSTGQKEFGKMRRRPETSARPNPAPLRKNQRPRPHVSPRDRNRSTF